MQSIKVLVVDDEIFITELISDYLSELNIDYDLELEVDCAKNGQEAYELLQKNLYTLVITDNRMPLLKGVNLIKLIRRNSELNKDTEFVLMSGSLEEIGIVLLTSKTKFLSKPFNLEKFDEYLYHSIESRVVS